MNFVLKLCLIFVFYNLFILSGITQNIKEDSLKIEATFLSAIGNKELLDSLELSELIGIRKTENSYVLEDTYWYNLSKARFLSGQIDKAFIAADEGQLLNKTKGKSSRSAKFYNLKASVCSYKKENKKAIQYFKNALSILEKKKDKHTTALIQNNIANLYISLLDYKSAYNYSAASYHQLLFEKDTIHLPSITGIFAITALKLNKTVKGKKLAKESLNLSEKYNNPIGLIVSNHSMGEVYNTDNEYLNAIDYFKKSLQLSQTYQQAHFIMLNKIGLQYATLHNKQYNESINYGEEALKETLQQENENTLYALHKNLGYAYDGLKNRDKAFYHLNLAHNYYMEASGVENQKAINDILIKYETEKKEKELILSRLVNSKNKNKLIKRDQWIIILCVVLLLILISYFFYNRIQKEKIIQLKKEQESKRLMAAIAAEEKERERISNELHDGMASIITGVNIKLEDFVMNDNAVFLSPIINQLKNLHDETRRISHNLMPLGLNNVNWTERIQQYCEENTGKSFKILFSNNLQHSYPLEPSIAILIYRSMQEFIHNAQKHSKSNVCYIQLSQLNNELIISVEDEGIGINNETIMNSQGLKSIEKRLLAINAQLTIESKLGEGTLVSIHIKNSL